MQLELFRNDLKTENRNTPAHLLMDTDFNDDVRRAIFISGGGRFNDFYETEWALRIWICESHLKAIRWLFLFALILSALNLAGVIDLPWFIVLIPAWVPPFILWIISIYMVAKSDVKDIFGWLKSKKLSVK